jgi:hypothetical protein
VRLRLIFDDAHRPDFELDLWRPEDDGRRGRLAPDEALQEANRWLARLEAVLRRRIAAKPAPAVAPPPRPAPVRAARPLEDEENGDEDDLVDDEDGRLSHGGLR